MLPLIIHCRYYSVSSLVQYFQRYAPFFAFLLFLPYCRRDAPLHGLFSFVSTFSARSTFTWASLCSCLTFSYMRLDFVIHFYFSILSARCDYGLFLKKAA